MTLDERLEEAKLSIFVPASMAAVCADCGGVFLLTAGQCPGCTSRQWVLMESSPIVAKQAEEPKP